MASSSSFTSVNSTPDSEQQSIKRKNSASNKQGQESCLWGCLVGCSFFILCALLICFLLAFLVYAVYAIMALAETGNNDIKEKCPDNNSWYCVLVVLILGTMVNSNKVKSEIQEKDDESQTVMTQLCGFCCWATINIVMIVWLNNNVNDICFDENFKDTKLWLVANIQFWLYISVTSLVGFVLVMASCVVTYDSYTHSKVITKNSNKNIV